MSKFLELIEAKVGIQVIDPEESVKDLKKLGVKAKAKDDEVIVDTKDKEKVKEWMLSAGWEEEDLEDIYPELLESLLSESWTNVEKEVSISDAHSNATYAIRQYRVALERYAKGKYPKNLDQIKIMIKMLKDMDKNISSPAFLGKGKANRAYLKDPINLWIRNKK